MPVHFQDLRHQTALQGGLLQRHNSFSWWFSSREPTCAGSPRKNELWRRSGIWLHCLMVRCSLLTTAGLDWVSRWTAASWWWEGLALRQVYQREVSSPGTHKFEVFVIFYWIFWGNQLGLMIQHFCLSVLSDTITSSICLVELSRFFSLGLFFSTRDQVGWAQLGTSRKGSFIVICGNYLVKHKNILFIYILLNNIHKRRINLYWTSLSS